MKLLQLLLQGGDLTLADGGGLRGLRGRVVSQVGRAADVRVAGELRDQLLFQRRAAERDVRDVDQQQVFLARVVAAFMDVVAGQFGGRDAQGLDDQGRQRGFIVVQRELELGQTHHGSVLSEDPFSGSRRSILSRAARPTMSK